jgi:hypothetical protein
MRSNTRYRRPWQIGAGAMPHYRAYLVAGERIIAPPFELVCENDDDAIARTGRHVLNWDIELWQGDRLVIRLRRRSET